MIRCWDHRSNIVSGVPTNGPWAQKQIMCIMIGINWSDMHLTKTWYCILHNVDASGGHLRLYLHYRRLVARPQYMPPQFPWGSWIFIRARYCMWCAPPSSWIFIKFTLLRSRAPKASPGAATNARIVLFSQVRPAQDPRWKNSDLNDLLQNKGRGEISCIICHLFPHHYLE